MPHVVGNICNPPGLCSSGCNYTDVDAKLIVGIDQY